MEANNVSATSLGAYMEDKRKEILAWAQKNTEQVVKTELALMDFELLLAVNTKPGEAEKSAIKARKLRDESWDELSKKFSGDYDKTMCFIENY